MKAATDPQRLRPIRELPSSEAQGLVGLLFDLDDTLLDGGSLGEAAYAALFRLRDAGLELFAVTGRPYGWAEVLARLWPVSGVIAENGAIAAVREGQRVRRLDPAPRAERTVRRARVEEVARDVARRFPELADSDDLAARVTDHSFDIGEFARIPRAIVERAMEHARGAGLHVFASSVHLHLSADAGDKATGTLRTLETLRGLARDEAVRRFAYIGDSENDAPCFAAFSTSIGVANLSPGVSVAPRFVTRAACGAGFAEAAGVLIARGAGRRHAGP